MERNANPQNIPTLPEELNINIVERLSVVDKVTAASSVCKQWWTFLKDPKMWKILDMRNNPTLSKEELRNIFTYAITRSSGTVKEIYINNFATDQLLQCIRDSPSVKVLELLNCHAISNFGSRQCIPRLVLLEKLTIFLFQPYDNTIDVIGQSYPRLTSFDSRIHPSNFNNETGINYHSMAIGMSMTALRTLKISSTDKLTNIGIESILDGCKNLQLLDIEDCDTLNLVANMRERCQTEIEKEIWPQDYLENAEDGFLDDMDDLRHYG